MEHSQQTIPDDIVYTESLKVLSEDESGEMERLLESIIQWQKEHPPQTEYDGFEWFQVQADARTLNKLVTRRILQIKFKSNKSTLFHAQNIPAMEKAINDYRGMTAPLVEEEPQVPPDLFQVVVGHNEKKEILWRSIGSEKPAHFILYGSVASAKTLMLQELTRLPKSRFVLGSSLSKAGLYEVMFNESPKYLIIDEIDKIEDEDNLSALLSLMETGFLSETKWRRHRKRYFRTWVFASANDLEKIPKELRSRFGKLRFRDYTDQEFFEVTVHVLIDREKISPNIAAYIAERTLKDLETKDVREAIRVARLLKTQDKKDVDHIIDIFQKQK